MKLLQRLQHWAENSILVFVGYPLSDTHIRDLVYDIDPGRRRRWYIIVPNSYHHDNKFWAGKSIDIIDTNFGEFRPALETKLILYFAHFL